MGFATRCSFHLTLAWACVRESIVAVASLLHLHVQLLEVVCLCACCWQVDGCLCAYGWQVGDTTTLSTREDDWRTGLDDWRVLGGGGGVRLYFEVCVWRPATGGGLVVMQAGVRGACWSQPLNLFP